MATATGVAIGSERTARLVARTEGWPAAIYLGLRAAGSALAQDRPEEELQGTVRSLADYMRSELLDHWIKTPGDGCSARPSSIP